MIYDTYPYLQHCSIVKKRSSLLVNKFYLSSDPKNKKNMITWVRLVKSCYLNHHKMWHSVWLSIFEIWMCERLKITGSWSIFIEKYLAQA